MLAHGGEAGDGGGFHVDQAGAVGGGEAALLRLDRRPWGWWQARVCPAPASQLKALAGPDVDDAGDVVGAAGRDVGVECSGPADGEDEVDGAAVFDGGEGAGRGGLAGAGAGGDPLFFFGRAAPRTRRRCGCRAASRAPAASVRRAWRR